MAAPLRTLPRKVFDGFGYSVRSEACFATPNTVEDLRALLVRATDEKIPVIPRGGGRSYGDPAMNRGALILDMRKMARILNWDEDEGILEAEPGLTIKDLWEHSLPRHHMPRVVPGTMFPTLGGCAAMNIHGKNHRQLGGFGDAILEADLLTPTGQLYTVSRQQHSELFHAAISGFGMLGVLTRLRLKLKRVYSGRLRVQQLPARNLAEQFRLFRQWEGKCDYLVSWVDCIVGGKGLGRGQVHVAHYAQPDEDPDPGLFLPERQVLPPTIMGVPRSIVGKVLGLFNNNLGMRAVNLAKYLSSRFGSTREYRQGHIAFHFLLDYVPTFRLAYWPDGFIQYQPFVPAEHAEEVFGEILRRTQAAGIVSYLGVLKRYRPDDFLLSHALDGYSIALDFPAPRAKRKQLWALCHELSELVLEAGGKFYPAKDSVMRPQDFVRSYGEDAVERFRQLRQQHDPHRVLGSELSRRVGVDD